MKNLVLLLASLVVLAPNSLFASTFTSTWKCQAAEKNSYLPSFEARVTETYVESTKANLLSATVTTGKDTMGEADLKLDPKSPARVLGGYTLTLNVDAGHDSLGYQLHLYSGGDTEGYSKLGKAELKPYALVHVEDYQDCVGNRVSDIRFTCTADY